MLAGTSLHASDRSQRQLAAPIIRYRIVPPDRHLSPVDLLDFRDVRQRNALADNPIARIHHEDILVQQGCDRLRIGLHAVLRHHILRKILRRHGQQRLYPGLLVDEALVHRVPYRRLALPILIPDIIEENRELPHSGRIQGIKLGQKRCQVLLTGLACKTHIQPRRNRENELYAIPSGLPDQCLQALQLCLRIRLTPLLPMIGIVLGRVNIHIEPLLLHEFQRCQPVRLRPRRAIEALHHPAHRNGGSRCLHGPGIAQQAAAAKRSGQ